MKKKIYNILENTDTTAGKLYDIFMIVVIILSILPLCFYNPSNKLMMLDKITVWIFIVDYILRLFTADVPENKGIKSYFKYPLKPMAIIDILTILPSFIPLNNSFRIFRLLRLIRAFRVFKFFRYSKSIKIFKEVIIEEKNQLLTVCMFAISYIIVSALIVFQVEPNTFHNLFHAIYWATVSLTTVGYGDLYPISDAGRIISMISSFLGIAVIALPSGIIVSGYQKVLHDEKRF